MTDLPERLKQRHASAWNEFYDQHRDVVYGFVLRTVSGDRPVADDLFQETWLRAMENIGSFNTDRGDLPAWLFGIARRRVALYWRRRLSNDDTAHCSNDALPEPIDATLLPVEAMEHLERADIVNAALLVMSEIQSQVLQWKYADGLSVAAIASRCGRSEKAVESLLSRARERLRCLLGPAFDDALAENNSTATGPES